MNRGGAQARLDYEKRRDMTRGDTEVVKAAVTLNHSVPPRKVLDRVGAEGVPGIVVSCSLQARITASRYEFDIEQNGWVPRSLLATDTARWAWDVTPKVGGQHTIVLSVRPIAVQEEPLDDSTQILASEEDANVQQYEINVAVNVPWAERPAEFMTQVAATLAVAEEVVKALTAVDRGRRGLARGTRDSQIQEEARRAVGASRDHTPSGTRGRQAGGRPRGLIVRRDQVPLPRPELWLAAAWSSWSNRCALREEHKPPCVRVTRPNRRTDGGTAGRRDRSLHGFAAPQSGS